MVSRVILLVLIIACFKANSQTFNASPYCSPLYASSCTQPGPNNAPGNFVNDFINSFYTTGANYNISNLNTGCGPAPAGYINYCNRHMAVSPGQVITCSVEVGLFYNQAVAIFIDWNQNTVFDTPSEMATFTNVIAGSWAGMTFTVPPAQVNGIYRMRVRCARGNNGSAVTPCTNLAYGETEDYNLHVGLPAPGPVTITPSTGSLCPGVATTLTASGAVSYTWGNGATGSSLQITPTVSAYYFVMSPNGSCTNFNGVFLSVYPSFSVQANGVMPFICSGSSVTYTASGANTYSWLPSGTGTTVNLTPSVTTTYTLVGSNGVCTESLAFTQSVSPSPSLQVSSTNSLSCQGDQVVITATGASSYTWSNGANANNIVVNPTSTTIYSVTGSNGTCTSTAVFTQSVVICTMLKDEVSGSSKIIVWPNPFTGRLYVESSKSTDIQVYDLNGRLLLNEKGIGLTTLDMHLLEDGVYLLSVQTSDEVLRTKIIKQGNN